MLNTVLILLLEQADRVGTVRRWHPGPVAAMGHYLSQGFSTPPPFQTDIHDLLIHDEPSDELSDLSRIYIPDYVIEILIIYENTNIKNNHLYFFN
jgi:hypothetical protein